MITYGKQVIEHKTHGSQGSSLVVKNKDTTDVPTPPPLEVEPPWPPDVILPVKYKVENFYLELPVVINFEGGSAIVDFGDGSEIREYIDVAEYTYPEVLGAEVPPVPFVVTVTPTSRIPLLIADIRELTDWGSAGSVNRFKFTHVVPVLPENIPPWIRDTSYMFEGCQHVDEGANLHQWDVSNVENMSFMFAKIQGFNQDISMWDTGNVTNMESMFDGCNGFNVDLSDWNVSKVTNMRRMFWQCHSLEADLNNWNVGKVTTMSGMFSECHGAVGSLEEWDVSQVVDMSYLLHNAITAALVNPSKWNVSNVTNMKGMFACETTSHKFNSDLSKWNVSNVINMESMFDGCHSLFAPLGDSWDDDVDPSSGFWSMENWDVGKVTTMKRMFYGCFEGVPSNISDWDTSSVTDMSYMFSDCHNMNHLTHWNTSKVTTMESMFEGAYQFNSDLSRWDVSNVENMDRMFKGVSWLVTSLDKWCVEKISEEPIEFMSSADYMDRQNKPIWGTCPSR